MNKQATLQAWWKVLVSAPVFLKTCGLTFTKGCLQLLYSPMGFFRILHHLRGRNCARGYKCGSCWVFFFWMWGKVPVKSNWKCTTAVDYICFLINHQCGRRRKAYKRERRLMSIIFTNSRHVKRLSAVLESGVVERLWSDWQRWSTKQCVYVVK